MMLLIIVLLRIAGVIVTSYITGVGVTYAPTLHTLLLAGTVAFVLAIINHTIRPILVFVTLPFSVLTFGLFSFILNGAMVLLASKLVPEFIIPSLFTATIFAFVLSVITWGIDSIEH